MLPPDGPPPDGCLDLLVVGDCNPDVLVTGGDVNPAFGQQEKLVDGISLVVGGSAAITAVAAARLGLRVALAAAVGDDPAGEFMLGQLTREGVGTGAVVVRRGTPTGMTVALSAGQDRAILTATGAMTTLTAQDVPASLLTAARHVHVSSYFLVERSLGPGLPGLLGAARAGGASTSLDTNWDPAQRWGDDNLRHTLAATGLLLPNETEALRLSGTPTLAEAMAALGPGLVVKAGTRGALWTEGTQRCRAEPPLMAPVDTTGAGDCFNAGLIAGLLGGLDLAGAVALGCAVGAASTQAPGGTAGCPDLPTAQALARSVRILPA
ncbi:MAG TPA: carbohydrate kinase family protein [Streptosporangiaceae bacterium]|nr:carbohydrate kinase family protein [Streptosporangiaceae bacterium]